MDFDIFDLYRQDLQGSRRQKCIVVVRNWLEDFQNRFLGSDTDLYGCCRHDIMHLCHIECMHMGLYILYLHKLG